MARRLRLGLLGTGVAAEQLYLPAFRALERRIELVACANRTRSKAERYARLAGVAKVVDDAAELLALPELQAVLISLPIDQQPRYVLQALRAGKAVLSEKPVAPSLAQGERLLRAARGLKAPWMVAENFAFMPHVHRLGAWLAAGRLGEVRAFEVRQITLMDRKNPYFRTAWRTRPKHVGGFVADGGVHLANVVQRYFGVPRRIRSLTGRFSRELPAPDSVVGVLEFPSGVLGSWLSCFHAHDAGPMLRIYGSKASAELHYHRALLLRPGAEPLVYQAPVDSFQAEFAHFAEVVLEGAPLEMTPQSALRDLALMQALVRGR